VCLEPQSPTSQYILFWYIAETLPPDIEKVLDEAAEEATTPIFGQPYQYPPPFPLTLTLADRLKMEPKGYVPPRHENTSADEEEALYESSLLPIEEAREKLRGTMHEDVVRRGWEAIQMRMSMNL